MKQTPLAARSSLAVARGGCPAVRASVNARLNWARAEDRPGRHPASLADSQRESVSRASEPGRAIWLISRAELKTGRGNVQNAKKSVAALFTATQLYTSELVLFLNALMTFFCSVLTRESALTEIS